jgi:hypothetical protein
VAHKATFPKYRTGYYNWVVVGGFWIRVSCFNTYGKIEENEKVDLSKLSQ